ncbi:transglutaminase domain-containing protein [Butyrivibrio sp. INlla16]|uniref:transglutaminase family protein n=1 Tax=Butyrivibrio sp. INlla16 TaxID=1520807 RepID=UPI00088F3DFF|nr:transglutaminase domain-containing protein [Butyrivibrio sp. INlla16]SDB57694.1 Transglutaminase-like superfamily protein [Butyrivibrio sp. INlla16]
MIVEILYDLLFIMPLSVAVSSFTHGYFEPEEMKNAWIVIAVGTTLYLLLMKHLKLRGRAVLAGILLAAVLAFWLIVPSEDRIDVLRENSWIFREMAVTAAVFVVGFFSGKYRNLRILIAAGGCIFLALSLFTGMTVEKISVCVILVYTLLVAVDEIQRFSVKEGDTEPRKHLVAVSPFLIVVFALISALGVSDKPYDWGIVKRISGFVVSEYVMLSESVFGENGWDTGSAVIGFSNRGEFAGDLSANKRIVMRLKSGNENDPRLYLSGKTFDTFDGHSWDKKDTSEMDERLADTIETVSFALDEMGEDPVTDVLKRVALTIEYKDMHTKCLFTPGKYLPLGDKWQKRQNEGGDIEFPNKRAARKPYDVVFYRLNKDSELFDTIARDSHEVSKESFEAAKAECGIDSDFSYEDFLKYREAVYANYLPKTVLSDKMRDYVDGILEGADSDYEKLKRLEGMFAEFKYTESPGEIPDEVKSEADFLDYFILNKKEGYCSYYATAFVLLARAYGIPARYVQGFNVPMGRHSIVEVSSVLAHAWPEAYIEGLGWIGFEPTPGMRSDVAWAVQSERELLLEKEREAYLAAHAYSEEEEETYEEPVEEKTSIKIDWYKILIPVFAGVSLTLLMFALDRLLKRRRYLRMSERGKATTLCKNSMELLRRRHLGRRQDETLSEYEERLSGKFSAELLSFLGTYEEILYSDREITEPERIEMEERFSRLKKFCFTQRRALRASES